MCRNTFRVSGIIDSPFTYIGKSEGGEKIYICIVRIPNINNTEKDKRVLIGLTTDLINPNTNYIGRKIVASGYNEVTKGCQYGRCISIRLCSNVKAITPGNNAYIEGSIWIEPRPVNKTFNQFSIESNNTIVKCFINNTDNKYTLKEGDRVSVSGKLSMQKTNFSNKNIVFVHKITVNNENEDLIAE